MFYDKICLKTKEVNMNNSDRISPYRPSNIPTYQNVPLVNNAEFLENLPQDVLEMIQQGDLEGAMDKLQQNAQENEHFMTLFFQMMGQMTGGIFESMAQTIKNMFSRINKKDDADKTVNPTKTDLAARPEGKGNKLTTEEDFTRFMRTEVEKMNAQQEGLSRGLEAMFLGRILHGMKTKISKMTTKVASLFKKGTPKTTKLSEAPKPSKLQAIGKMMRLNRLKLYAQMFGKNIKKMGTMLDQKVMQLTNKMVTVFQKLSQPIVKQSRDLAHRFEGVKYKVTASIKERFKVFKPFAEKIKVAKNKVVELRKTATEWLSNKAKRFNESTRRLAETIIPKPAIRLFNESFRNLPDYANSLKDVVKQNVQAVAQLIQHFNQVAVATLVPVVNLFLYAQRGTMNYSLNGLKFANKKMKEGLKKFKDKIAEHMIAIQDQVVAAVIATIEASRWCLKTLYAFLMEMLNIAKEFVVNASIIVWKVLKGGSFILWNIISTLPSAAAFLIRVHTTKLKKSILAYLRKRKAG